MNGEPNPAVLALRFAVLSLFAIGGGVSVIIPQLHQEFVVHDRWFDERTFTQLIAVAQATPGPNFLLVPLIGWHAAGWPGAFASLGGFLAIPASSALIIGRALRRHDTPLLALLRRSFRTLTAGLWVAAGLVIASATDRDLVPRVVTGAVVVAALAADINPLWWFLAAALAGAAFG